MKFLLLLLFISITGKAFGQDPSGDTAKKYHNAHAPQIAAKDAYKYIGKMVVVVDSLYNGKIASDSTLVCQMGEETNTPRLTMIYVFPVQFRPVDLKFFNTFRRFRIVIYGIITGSKDAPVLILHGSNNMTIETKRYRYGERK